MSKKIIIPQEILHDLYVKRKFSTYKIGKILDCDPTVIQKRLKEHNIRISNPKKKKLIVRRKLYDLYVNKKFSTQKVANILDIGSSTILNKLREFQIPTRNKKVIYISKKELKNLYYTKNLPCSQIAKLYGCNNGTIFRKLKKYKIKTRNASEANTIFTKEKFTGDKRLKAYMIGFRLGDLNVNAKNSNSTIFLKSSTTREEQLNLIKEVYGIYGHFITKYNKGVYNIQCNLDKSFNFLIKKEDNIENWILSNNKYFLPFLSGYIDAEGSFGVYQKKARFRLGSYDKNILSQIQDELNSFNIINNLNLESKAIKGKQNKDFYRISISEKQSLFRFIELISTHIQHKKRYNDMILCKNNLLERNKNLSNDK